MRRRPRPHFLSLILAYGLAGTIAWSGNELTGNLTGIGAQGAPPVNISVDAFSGAASGKYPLQVPPGRSGLAPELVLSYNSSSTRPGYLGKGWDLGLPSIQRSTRKGQPRFDWTDEFALNLGGRALRLVLWEDRTSGGVGVREFRTQVDTFTRIYAYTSALGGSVYWELWDGSGKKYQFGLGTHQNASAISTTNNFFWALNSILDQYGNYIDFEYLLNSGTLYPSVIRYTGNTNGLLPDNHVQFFYEGRNDVTVSRLGKPSEIRYRLRNVKMYVGSEPVSAYLFDYSTLPVADYPVNQCTAADCGTTSIVCSDGSVSSCTNSCSTTTGLCAPACTPPSCPSGGGGHGRGPQIAVAGDVQGPTETTAALSATASFPVYSSSDQPSLMTKVTQFDGRGYSSFPPSIFTYAPVVSTNTLTSVPITFSQLTCTNAGTASETRTVTDYGVALADITGDAIPEVIKSIENDCTGQPDVEVYDGATGTFSAAFPVPLIATDCAGRRRDAGARLIDVNGDQLIDAVASFRESNNLTTIRSYVFLNPGTGSLGTNWSQASYSIPVAMTEEIYAVGPGGVPFWTSTETGVRFGDVNGDGLIDLVQSLEYSGGCRAPEKGVYLNTGTGWGPAQSGWAIPVYFATRYCGTNLTGDTGARLVDINGDGLADIIKSASINGSLSTAAWLGRAYSEGGIGQWESTSEWALPSDPFSIITTAKSPGATTPKNLSDGGVRLADINGDGLVDIIVTKKWDGTTTRNVYLHRAGKGWASDAASASGLPISVEHLAATGLTYDLGVRLADRDGNGSPDFYVSLVSSGCSLPQSGSRMTFTSKGFSDLLTSVKNPAGGTTDLVYTPLAKTFNEGQAVRRMPFSIPVVTRTTVNDGLTGSVGVHSYETNYDRGGAYYHGKSREYRGFRYVRTRSPQDQTYTDQLFVQDRALDVSPLVGAVERVLQYNGNYKEHALAVTSYKRESRTAPAGSSNIVYFATPEHADTYLYDSSLPFPYGIDFLPLDQALKHLQTNFTYSYDLASTELVTSLVTGALGDLSTNADDLYTTAEYRNDTAGWRVGLLRRSYQSPTANASARVNDSWFSYDGQTYDSTAPIALGNLTSTEAWSGGAFSSYGSPENRRTTYAYDSFGHVTRTTDPAGHAQFTDYGTGQSDSTFPLRFRTPVTTTTGSVEHVAALQFDRRFGIPTRVDTPGDGSRFFAYDAFGRLTKAWTDRDSSSLPTTCYFYDSSTMPLVVARFDRELSSAGDACGPVGMLGRATFYDGLGHAIEGKIETDEPGYQSIVSGAILFDSQGRVGETKYPFFSNSSLLTYVPPPATQGMKSEYDSLGRVKRLTLPPAPGTSQDRVITTSYSVWTTTTTDIEQRATQTDHDAYGHAIESRTYYDPSQGGGLYSRTQVVYDALGRQSRTIDDLGNTTSYLYNSYGELVETDGPALAISTRTYDQDGLLTQNLTGRGGPQIGTRPGFISYFTYDELHRVVTIRDMADASFTYNYDEPQGRTTPGAARPLGHVTSIDSSTGLRQEFEYDSIGIGTVIRERIPTIAHPEGEWFGVSQIVDNLGRTRTLTYPDYSSFSRAYNAAGQVASISGIASQIRYTATGELASIDYANGRTALYQYDPATTWLQELRLCTSCAPGVPGIALQNTTYTYYPGGAMNSATDLDATGALINQRSFALDHLYRLTQADSSSSYHNLAYAYDTIGNLTSKEGTGFLFGAAPHQPTSTTTGLNFTYGESGELRSQTDLAGHSKTYDYTGFGQLQYMFDSATGRRTYYSYNAQGSRVRSLSILGSTTQETIRLSSLYKKTGDSYSKFITLGSLPLAVVEGTVAAGDTRTLFYMEDQLRGTRLVMDQAGSIVLRLEYKPYGELSSAAASNYTPDYRFAGALYDEDTGLYDFGARDYDPTTARFLTVDPAPSSPLNILNLNPFGYAAGNPTSHVDFGGLSMDEGNPLCIGWFCFSFGYSSVDNDFQIAFGIGVSFDSGSGSFAPIGSQLTGSGQAVEAYRDSVFALPMSPASAEMGGSLAAVSPIFMISTAVGQRLQRLGHAINSNHPNLDEYRDYVIRVALMQSPELPNEPLTTEAVDYGLILFPLEKIGSLFVESHDLAKFTWSSEVVIPGGVGNRLFRYTTKGANDSLRWFTSAESVATIGNSSERAIAFLDLLPPSTANQLSEFLVVKDVRGIYGGIKGGAPWADQVLRIEAEPGALLLVGPPKMVPKP